MKNDLITRISLFGGFLVVLSIVIKLSYLFIIGSVIFFICVFIKFFNELKEEKEENS